VLTFFRSVQLSLNGKDGSDWIAKIFNYMPDAIRQRALEKLNLYFELQPDTVKSVDQTNKDFAFHYHTWFRNTTSVSIFYCSVFSLSKNLQGTKRW
jgi:hypothetical protein